jgi:hypothetical protein
MEEIGKRRLAAALVVVALLAYFLVCAFPLHKELVLMPVWTKSISVASVAQTANTSARQKGVSEEKASGEKVIPFRLGNRYGYFSPDGNIIFSAVADYGVALAPDAYATYDRLSEGFTIKSPYGAELARVAATGYPFFAAGRRFVIGPDQMTVSELSEPGAIKWSYQLASVATAFNASPSLVVFGLIDGTIVGLDSAGKAVLDFAPGGSRIAGVYGVAVSPDGLLVAAVTGADKQRLVILEKRSAAYRVAYHRYLSSDYRRPVYITFTSDGSRLAYESSSGIAVYDRDTKRETIISVPATAYLGQTIRRGQLMVVLSGSGDAKRLICTALPDRRVLDVPVKASLAFVEAKNDSLFLGTDDSLVRMDFEER